MLPAACDSLWIKRLFKPAVKMERSLFPPKSVIKQIPRRNQTFNIMLWHGNNIDATQGQKHLSKKNAQINMWMHFLSNPCQGLPPVHCVVWACFSTSNTCSVLFLFTCTSHVRRCDGLVHTLHVSQWGLHIPTVTNKQWRDQQLKRWHGRLWH